MDDYEYILECIDAKLARIAEALEVIAGTKKAAEENENKNVRIDDISIDDISLRHTRLLTKTRNALLRNGFKTVGDVRRLSRIQLIDVRGIGSNGLKDIEDMLSDFGIELPIFAKGE